MILILSRSEGEPSTNDIIDNLRSLNANFYRFNGDDLVNGRVEVNFYINEDKEWDFKICDLETNIKISKKNINAVWFRRNFNDSNFEYDENIEGNQYLRKEIRRVYTLFEIVLRNKFWINKPSDTINKFLMFQAALDIGMEVPNTFVTNNLNFIKKSLPINNNYITKSASDCTGFLDNGYVRSISTHRINTSEIKDDFFFPSKIQAEVKKEYEVRTFFLENKTYSMAIFSQKNNKTELDYRNYDLDSPNRMSKYTIPKSLQIKTNQLMEKLEINCGSIDFIKGTDGKYYFLEVNPVGQFGFTSIQGNYNLEKIIATKLKDEDEKNYKTN